MNDNGEAFKTALLGAAALGFCVWALAAQGHLRIALAILVAAWAAWLGLRRALRWAAARDVSRLGVDGAALYREAIGEFGALARATLGVQAGLAELTDKQRRAMMMWRRNRAVWWSQVDRVRPDLLRVDAEALFFSLPDATAIRSAARESTVLTDRAHPRYHEVRLALRAEFQRERYPESAGDGGSGLGNSAAGSTMDEKQL